MEEKLPAFLTLKQLQTRVISWSRDTVKRKVKEEKFPMIKDGESGQLLFPTKQVLEWFKRREVNAG